MGVKTIDANMLKNMFLAGAKRIESKKEWINELNVFPVPDGETGPNMTMTRNTRMKTIPSMTMRKNTRMKTKMTTRSMMN